MILCFKSEVFCVDACCAMLLRITWDSVSCTGCLQSAHWLVHQWRLYERSLCSLLELQARKGSYAVCCSPRYVLAPEYRAVPLPLTTQRPSPPPAHL